MRRFVLLILSLAITALVPSESSAKGTTLGKPKFYINSGLAYTMAQSNLKRNWKPGLNFGAGMGVPMNPRITAVGYIDYNSLGFRQGGLILETVNFRRLSGATPPFLLCH